jgi:hypothetical protein
VLDPISIQLALGAMRAAYSGIQYCCDSLREGTVEIQRIKKTTEQAVNDAKTIYREVTGLWGWLQGLFGAPKPAEPTPSAPVAVAEPVAKKKARAKEQYTDHIPTQDEVVQQFIEHLGIWFENYGKLKEYAEHRYKEVFEKDEINSKEVLELTQLQAELDSAYPTLSTLMSGAPWQLGPIWTQFKEMQDKVKAGQAARQLKQRREKANREARAAQIRSDRIDRNMTIVWTAVLIWFFWMMMGVVWLNTKTML